MVYLSEGGQGGGRVVLPSPGSEPRLPPYSPPRPSSLNSQDTAPIKDPPPPYPPTTNLKAAHAALNHGPSSASPPPTKTIKYLPPPYTPADTTSSSGRLKVLPPQVQQPPGPRAPGSRDLSGHATDPRHRTRRPHSHRHQPEKTRPWTIATGDNVSRGQTTGRPAGLGGCRPGQTVTVTVTPARMATSAPAGVSREAATRGGHCSEQAKAWSCPTSGCHSITRLPPPTPPPTPATLISVIITPKT
ncbi:extensin-like [Homarus americanus]|uniref:extensin-like n=1 Tax=Homarus americanus TaxID=6706 RepID=UPI001C45CF9D|nr:extensin-like [Homarus americanus]